MSTKEDRKRLDKELIEGKIDCMEYVELINEITNKESEKSIHVRDEREYI